MKSNTRSLKIQYRWEKVTYSLPTINVPTLELEVTDVMELLGNGMTAQVVVNLLNSQCHIAYSSRAGERIIKETYDLDGESAHEGLDAVAAKGIDFREEIERHAAKLAERQQKGVKVDKIIDLIRTKWAQSTKKEEFLKRLNLPMALLHASAAEVEAAYVQARDSAEDWL